MYICVFRDIVYTYTYTYTYTYICMYIYVSRDIVSVYPQIKILCI